MKDIPSGRILAVGSEAKKTLARVLERGLLGHHASLQRARSRACICAPNSAPVLITGPTGSGKDLLARLIHDASPRGSRLPVIVTPACLGTTAESVLFGHRKWAYTDAREDREGLFLEANGSTLIFEDIAEAPLDVQPKILRAIEHHLIRPLGAESEIRADVRVIATTNQPLEQLMGEGRFRADLYYRLAVLRIELPALRQHMEDLPLYVTHLLSRMASPGVEPKRLSSAALDALQRCDWPGNVRELENTLLAASLDCDGPVIEADVIRTHLPTGPAEPRGQDAEESRTLDRLTLLHTLAQTNWNKREAARRLRVCIQTLYRRMAENGIPLKRPAGV